MRDLNTLIAPGSGFQLTNAFNINDRGEILAKAAPLGFTPNDDADLGHLVLLIPCDREHSDDEGCDAGAESTTALRSAASVQSSPTVDQSSAESELGTHLHNRFGRKNVLGAWPRK